MFEVTTNNKSVIMQNDKKDVITGEAINNVRFDIVESSTIVWYCRGKYLASSAISKTSLNGETLTDAADALTKLSAALFF